MFVIITDIEKHPSRDTMLHGEVEKGGTLHLVTDYSFGLPDVLLYVFDAVQDCGDRRYHALRVRNATHRQLLQCQVEHSPVWRGTTCIWVVYGDNTSFVLHGGWDHHCTYGQTSGAHGPNHVD